MTHKRIYSLEVILQVTMAVFNIIAFVVSIYLVMSLRHTSFIPLTRAELWALLLLVSLLGISCVHGIITLGLRYERLSIERTLKNEKKVRQIYDQSSFNEIFRKELQRAGRYRLPTTVAFIDIDGFEAIVEQHGREDSDKITKNFGELVVSVIRSSDYLVHYGESEFCVLLCHTDLVHAENFLLRLLLQSQERMDLNFSAGVTAYRIGEDHTEFLQRARTALSEARKTRQKRVHCSIGKDDRPIIKNL